MCDGVHLGASKHSIPELPARFREFLSNVSGFLESKLLLDATAARVLPHKWMERHPSFVLSEESLVQRNLRGERVKNLDELHEVAREAKPKFDSIMANIVRDSGLDPAMIVSSKDGKPLMINHNTPFRVLSLADLKGVGRMAEKASNELKGDFSRLVDVVRCSVVVFTEEQLESVAQPLKRLSTKRRNNNNINNRGIVVRLKNRFKTPLFNGYRDALYNIMVYCDGGSNDDNDAATHAVTHVCEVQLHLADIVAHKESTCSTSTSVPTSRAAGRRHLAWRPCNEFESSDPTSTT